MTGRLPVPISVLGLCPVPTWVAEHHNMPGIASSAPAVLAGQIASATSAIRVGSGGVMLPNHSPLTVAEQFGTLEAMYPGRIDLGVGRAPGTDRATARALRRSPDGLPVADLAGQLAELRAYFAGEPADGGSRGEIRAIPAEGNEPTVWLLGSTGYSAELAALLGLPFAFAYHRRQRAHGDDEYVRARRSAYQLRAAPGSIAGLAHRARNGLSR